MLLNEWIGVASATIELIFIEFVVFVFIVVVAVFVLVVELLFFFAFREPIIPILSFDVITVVERD